MKDLVHPLADYSFMRSSIACLSHHLSKGCVLIYINCVPDVSGTLTLNRCCVRIFSTSSTSGMRNLTPTCGIVSRFTKFFFRRMCLLFGLLIWSKWWGLVGAHTSIQPSFERRGRRDNSVIVGKYDKQALRTTLLPSSCVMTWYNIGPSP